MSAQAETLADLGGEMQLFDRPGGSRLGLATQVGGGEVVEQLAAGGMHGDQLSLDMRGQLADLDACGQASPFEFVAVILTLGGQREIHAAGITAGNLDTGVPRSRGPAGDRVERIERCLVAQKLCQEESRATHLSG